MEENGPKKRGRKKIVTVEAPKEQESEKKKRGRKKKWETTPFKTNYITENTVDEKVPETVQQDYKDYNTNNFTFGNICIKIHDKEQKENLKDMFINNKDEQCKLVLSGDEEDTCEKNIHEKRITIYKNGENKQVSKTDIRCFNCHHGFDNPPFYLPIDYCNKTNRFKIFGNYCSPNCVKSYCLNSKQYENKSYLVGQFYRRLFGANFRIEPAPSITYLIDYGGPLTIDQYRKTFYKNNRYIMSNIVSKIVTI
jgi:hypothetical protein